MSSATAAAVPPDVRRFHDDSLVFLAYTVTPLRLTRTGASLSHMRQWLDGPKTDLPKLKAGGVDAVFLSVGAETYFLSPGYDAMWSDRPVASRLYFKPVWQGAALVKRILWSIDAFHRMMDENDDLIELALSAEDIERIVAKGKMAGLLHITRGAIDNDLNVLRTYHRLGVRGMQIAYDDGSPDWVDACYAPPVANGLSDFGRDAIREMNRLGMVIDLAHASDKAYADVIAVSDKPVISSHSGARALCPVYRNLSDETMRALAAKGGMVGAFFGSGYLDATYLRTQEAYHRDGHPLYQRHRELAEKYADDPLTLALALRDPATFADLPPITPPIAPSPLSVLLEHIDHCIRIVGEDNYCLGSDFGGIDDSGVSGLDEPSKTANLTAALLAAGYSKETVRKILGTNLLRLFRAVVGH